LNSLYEEGLKNVFTCLSVLKSFTEGIEGFRRLPQSFQQWRADRNFLFVQCITSWVVLAAALNFGWVQEQ